MLTAQQISEKTGIELYTVRYRLSEMRRKGDVKSELCGPIYRYHAAAVKEVLNFNKKKG